MATETYLIAIRWLDGQHDIFSELPMAMINTEKLKSDGKLYDISSDEGFYDEGAILSVIDFSEYLLPKEALYSPEVYDWYNSINDDADFIFVHIAEY